MCPIIVFVAATLRNQRLKRRKELFALISLYIDTQSAKRPHSMWDLP
jgi:hypothetical protein